MSCPGDQLHIHSSSHTSRNGFSGAVDGENGIHKVKTPGPVWWHIRLILLLQCQNALWVWVQVLAAPLLTKHLDYSQETIVGWSCLWGPAPMWKMQKFPATSFEWAQLWLFQQFKERDRT